MKKIFLVLCILVLSNSLFAKTLATINGKVKIDSGEVDAVFGNVLMKQGIAPSSINMNDPKIQTFKKSILENLIKRELLYISAANDKPKNLDKLVEDDFKNIKKNFKTESEFNQYLANRGLSEKEIKNNIKKNIILQNYVKQTSEKVKVSDKEAKDFYDKNKAAFKQPEQVKASHIIILINKDKDEKKAKKQIDKIYKEIKNGLDFAEAAKKYSEDGSAQVGGDLGFFSKGKMVPEFEEVAFKMKKGEISKPFKSRFGYHILKVTDKKPEKQLTFDEVKESIKNKLVSDKTKKMLDDVIEKNRMSAKIEYAK